MAGSKEESVSKSDGELMEPLLSESSSGCVEISSSKVKGNA